MARAKGSSRLSRSRRSLSPSPSRSSSPSSSRHRRHRTNRHRSDKYSSPSPEARSQSGYELGKFSPLTGESTREEGEMSDNEDFIPFGLDDNKSGSTDEEATPSRKQISNSRSIYPSRSRSRESKRHTRKMDRSPGSRKRRRSRSGRRSRSYSPRSPRSKVSFEQPPIPWARSDGYDNSNPSMRLTEELKDLLRYIEPSPEEHCMRRYVVRRIEECVRLYWPSAKIIAFGSFNTHLYLPSSDIDLVCFNPGPSPGQPLGTATNTRDLYDIANQLKSRRICENCQVISKARVPIIKFEEALTGYHVDLSFNQPSGLDSAEAAKHLIKTLPGTRELTMLIKLFLSARMLNEVYTGGLGSYTILCLVSSFLQLHPRYPSMDPLENLGVLFLEFLELYGKTFNTEAVGIFVGMEGPGSGGYYPKRDIGRWDEGRPILLSIQDPVDADNDIGRNSFRFSNIRAAFSGAYEMLTRALFNEFKGFSSDPLTPIISRVLSIPPLLPLHRAKIYNLFTAGQMQLLFKESIAHGLRCEPQLVKEDERKIKDILAHRPPLQLKTLFPQSLASPQHTLPFMSRNAIQPPPPSPSLYSRRERFPLPPRPSFVMQRPGAPPGFVHLIASSHTTGFVGVGNPHAMLTTTMQLQEEENIREEVEDDDDDDELAKIYEREKDKRKTSKSWSHKVQMQKEESNSDMDVESVDET